MPGANITKAHANDLVKKLNASVETNKAAHDLASVFHNGQLIATFGIRRGSKTDSGHGHIPEALHLPTGQCRKLATCTLSRNEWIEILEEKGIVETPPKPQQPKEHWIGKRVSFNNVEGYVLYFNEASKKFVCQWMDDDISKTVEVGEPDIQIVSGDQE